MVFTNPTEIIGIEVFLFLLGKAHIDRERFEEKLGVWCVTEFDWNSIFLLWHPDYIYIDWLTIIIKRKKTFRNCPNVHYPKLLCALFKISFLIRREIKNRKKSILLFVLTSCRGLRALLLTNTRTPIHSLSPDKGSCYRIEPILFDFYLSHLSSENDIWYK